MNKAAGKDRLTKIIYIACIIIIAISTVDAMMYCIVSNGFGMPPMYIADVSVCITGMVLCTLLIFSLALDRPWDKLNRVFFRMIFVLSTLFGAEVVSCFIDGVARARTCAIAVNTLRFFGETLLIYCFWIYILEEFHISKKSIPVLCFSLRVILLFSLVQDLLNIKYGFFFSINSHGDYIYGEYDDVSRITTVIVFMVTWFVILRAKDHTKREKAILITFQTFPLAGHIVASCTTNYGVGYVYPFYLFSIMLIYINVFSQRGKKLLEQQEALDKQRAALMISQIQPHFLYNVLTTISNLCVTDPEEAEETTVLFAQYLRTNLDSLRQENPVPFSQELEHIKTYVELEKKRFGDKLNVETDCPCTDFLVPALGLQPIVENSVKHGIRGKLTPGHLKIISRKADGGYEVVIEDDGVGFDINAPLPDDGRSHVGMINVRSRLEQICNAKVEVVSSPGNGCRTTVFFPQKNM